MGNSDNSNKKPGRRASKHKHFKIQFILHKQTMSFLEDLVDQRDASSKAEVVRDALSVFKWVHDRINEGYKIYGYNETTDQVIKPGAGWTQLFPTKSVSVNAANRPEIDNITINADTLAARAKVNQRVLSLLKGVAPSEEQK